MTTAEVSAARDAAVAVAVARSGGSAVSPEGGGPRDGARVVVITGASRGIGEHLARAFAGAGYQVEASSRRGGPGVAELDVTDGAAVRSYVADLLARHGRIDVVINNAGVMDRRGRPRRLRPRPVVVGPRRSTCAARCLMTRHVLPAMLEAGSGRIINMNSGAGTRAGEVASAYNVSKTALARITGSTHLAGRGRGVYAFDLAPGVVRTDMTTAMRAHNDRTEWTDPADVSDLALALAGGELDAWSGRMVRAGADQPHRLRAASRPRDWVRTLAGWC